jgi:hypothetical protein
MAAEIVAKSPSFASLGFPRIFIRAGTLIVKDIVTVVKASFYETAMDLKDVSG